MTCEEPVSGAYMIRRKFYVPEEESVRDYYRKDLTPSDYLLPCDWAEVDDDKD